MSNEHVLVKELSVSFPKPVLSNVFLKIKKGELVAVVGKSGVGKTTLLNAVAGLVKYSGEIKKSGKVGFVFQEHALFPWMTVKENICFGMEKQDNNFADEIIQLTGLEEKKDFFPQQLSGGQQQRVSLGRALGARPELLLLDEPFASLDTYTRIEMQDWIKEVLQKKQITTLLVTHDVEEAILLSDRILVLKDRNIVSEFNVSFIKPRINEIRYLPEFQELKKKILEMY